MLFVLFGVAKNILLRYTFDYMIYSTYAVKYPIRLDFILSFFLVEEGVMWNIYYWYEEVKDCWELRDQWSPWTFWFGK